MACETSKMQTQQNSVIILGILLWITILLVHQASESVLINHPKQSFIYVEPCQRPIIEIEITEYVTKTVEEKVCPAKPPHCDYTECRTKGGNCVDNRCEWDSGYELNVDDFKPMKEQKFTWEKPGLSYEKLAAYSNNKIPHIFHQSWKNKEIPERNKEWVESCKQMQPKWDNLLWTDDDNRQLISREYPWLLYTFDRLRGSIFRADFVRYAYMHHFGGVYADLDVECLKPADELVSDKTIVLGVLGNDYDFTHNIPNAIFASKKGHPFWLFLMTKIVVMMNQNDAAEAGTGPIILRDSYRLFVKLEAYKNDFHITKPGILYAVDWHIPPPFCVAAFNQVLDTKKCKEFFPDAIMITYWTHGW